MKKFVVFFVVILFCDCIIAQQRTSIEIENVLRDFSQMYKKGKDVGYCLAKQQALCSEVSLPYYIYNDTINGGFVILSGDKRMKKVLGYVDNVFFDELAIPEAMKDLLSHYSQQYTYINKINQDFTSEEKKVATFDVDPILSTQWGQETPYNDMCPRSCPSGCVATAMSQIMYHYKYPENGYGSHSYYTKSNNYRCSFDFKETQFDWDNMLETYTSGVQYSELNASAIARLMYACGVSVSMDYTSEGSGAYDFDVPYALINYFGYNNNVVDYYRPYFKDSDWYDIIYTELQENRPVLYCGVDRKANGGHAFIIDGCSKSGKFHVNWGWNGDYNGDFELDALTPGKYSFISQQSMVIRISPVLVGKHEDTFYASKFSKQSMPSIENSEFSQYYSYKLSAPLCMASQTSYAIGASMNVRFCLGLCDENFNLISLMDSTNIIHCTSMSTLSDQTFRIKRDKMPQLSGMYYMVPLVKDVKNGNLTRIRTTGGLYDYLGFVIEDDGDENDIINDDNDYVLYEDFEDMEIPSRWYQEYEKGTSSWYVKKSSQVMASTNTPVAANGFSYITLGTTNDNAIIDSEIKTRIYTNIPLSNNRRYIMTFFCRRYSRLKQEADVLRVQVRGTKSREWYSIYEVVIDNDDEWIKVEVPMESSDVKMLAFEGIVKKGNAIFLDYIGIRNVDIVNNISHSHYYGSIFPNTVFTLSGLKNNGRNRGVFVENGRKIIKK